MLSVSLDNSSKIFEINLNNEHSSISINEKPSKEEASNFQSLKLEEFIYGSAEVKRKLSELIQNCKQSQSKHDSLLDDYGNKHKNLVKLDHLIEALQLSGISVPKPHGISSQQIITFLQKVVPELFTHWKELACLHTNHQTDGEFLADEKVQRILQNIDLLIKKAFSTAHSLQESSSLVSPELLRWIESIHQQGHYLMVRSTGAEDSKEAANAGGNSSIAYVPPSLEEFCRALGKVVSSYFSPISLQNRLDAGLNPFTEELKLAVTVQELIGEKVGGANDPDEIPKSLVIFTNEPLYIGNEKFRFMRISGTYGHGNAVVENQGIATDTVLILCNEADPTNLYILYDNRKKNTRLAPVLDSATEKVSLQKVENDPSLATKRVFDDELLAKLYSWGVIVEKFYDNDPTDMEIVVKGDKIYPVQARPVVRTQTEPTYLDLKSLQNLPNSPIEFSLQASMIVPGKASVEIISNANEILFAESLTEIQDNRLFKKGHHKLVVVAKEEPANSHPVVNFSSYGIPCLCAGDDLSTLKSKIDALNNNYALAVCIQSAQIHLWNTTSLPVEKSISKGFVVHPAKVAISLSETTPLSFKKGAATPIPQDVKDLLFQVRTAHTSKLALKYLHELKNHNWLKISTEKQAAYERALIEAPLCERTIRPLLNVTSELEKKIQRAFQEIERVSTEESEEHRMEFLFHAKVLDTLLFSQKNNEGALGQYSLTNLGAYFAAADEQIAYQKELAQPAYFMTELMYGRECPDASIFDQWRSFLLQLEQSKVDNETLSDLKEVLGLLKQLNALPGFLVMNFSNVLHVDPIQTAKNILALFPKEQRPLVNEILTRKEALQTLREQLDNFSDPKKFDHCFNSLKNELQHFSPQDEEPSTLLQQVLLAKNWNQCSPVIREMIINTLNECVDIYDSAIKVTKASQSFKNDHEKTKRFSEMLFPYFQLLEKWSQQTIQKNDFPMHKSWPLDRYLSEISKVLMNISQSDNPKHLFPSSGFSVLSAMLGSTTDFERHLPKHLEDVFTLIHQNLIAVTSKLSDQLLLSTHNLPLALQKAMSNVSTIEGQEAGDLQRIGVEINEKQIVVHYNVPLRNHSSRFALVYDSSKVSSPLTMDVQFLGQARGRWQNGADWANFYATINHQPPAMTSLKENELNYSIALGDDPTAAFQLFNEIAKLSLNYSLIDTDYFSSGNFNLQSLKSGIETILTGTKRPLFLSSVCDYICEKDFIALVSEINFYNLFVLINSSGKMEFRSLRNKVGSSGKEGVDILKLLAGISLDLQIEGDLDIPEDYEKKLIDYFLKLSELESLNLLEECFRSSNKAVQKLAKECCIQLINNNKHIDLIIKLVEKSMLDGNSTTRDHALNLYNELFKKNLGHQSALKVAAKAQAEINSSVKYSSLELYKALFALNIDHKETVTAVKRMLENGTVDENILKFCEKVLDMGFGYDLAKQALEMVLRSPVYFYPGIALLKKLLLKTQCYEFVEELAAKILFEESNSFPNELYKLLFLLDKGYDAAAKTAQMAILDKRSSVRYAGFHLYENLFLKGHNLDIAIEVIKQAQNDEDFFIKGLGDNISKNLKI